MKELIKWKANVLPTSEDRQLSIMSLRNVAKARFFHSSFPQYSITPLAQLDGMKPAGGIQKDHIVAVVLRVLHRLPGDGNRIALPHLKDGQLQLGAHDLQLLNGGGAVDVAGRQKGTSAVLPAHQARQLGAVGGFAGALQAHQHYHGGGMGGHEPGGIRRTDDTALADAALDQCRIVH